MTTQAVRVVISGLTAHSLDFKGELITRSSHSLTFAWTIDNEQFLGDISFKHSFVLYGYPILGIPEIGQQNKRPCIDGLPLIQGQCKMGHQTGTGAHMMFSTDYPAKAIELLSEIGVHQIKHGAWAFTDISTASKTFIHHSRMPVAVAAYAAVSTTFAEGRFPGWPLTELVDKVSCMDGIEQTALASVCGAPEPIVDNSRERAEVFGKAVWTLVDEYSLEGCFERVERPYGSEGMHYFLRPRGYDWNGDRSPKAEALKAMRKSYRSMTPVQQVMTLTILHLHSPGKDKHYLTGGCPTKISAAQALDVLKNDNSAALAAWAHLVSHYAGW